MAQIFDPGPSFGGNIGTALGTGLSGILEGLAVKKAKSVRAKRNYEGLTSIGIPDEVASYLSRQEDKELNKGVEGYFKNKQASSDQAASQEIMSDQPSRQTPFTGTLGQAGAQGQDQTLNMQRMPFNTQQFPGMQPQAPQGRDVPEMLSGIQQAIQQNPMEMLSQNDQFAPEEPQSFPESLQPAQRSPEEEINWLAGKIQQTNAHPYMSTAGKKNQTDQLYKKIEQIKGERAFELQKETPRMAGVQKKVDEAISKGIKAADSIKALRHMLKLSKRKDLSGPLKVAAVEAIKSGGPGAGIGSAIGGILGGAAGSVIPGVGTVLGAGAGAGAGATIGGGLTRGLDLVGSVLTNDTQKFLKDSAWMFNEAVTGLGTSGRNAAAIEGLKRDIPNINQAPNARDSLIRSQIKVKLKDQAKWKFIEDTIEKEGKTPSNIMVRAEKYVQSREDSIRSDYKKISREVKKSLAEKRSKGKDKEKREGKLTARRRRLFLANPLGI